MKYSQWLEQDFIPFYTAESAKDHKTHLGEWTKMIYICPILMIYEHQIRTKEIWKHEHCKALFAKIDSFLQNAHRTEFIVPTLSPIIGNTREDRIKWLIEEMTEAQIVESLQENHDGHG